jgi:hypothetical protein
MQVNRSQYKNKSCYYNSFKIRLESRPRARFELWVGFIIDTSQYKDKNNCYSFKTRLASQLGARFELWVGLIIETSQYKNKNGYYHSLKIYSKVEPRQGLGHGLGGSTRVDMSQRINKNDYYYYSIKIRLNSRSRTRLKSWVERVNLSLPKKKNRNQGSIVLTKNSFTKVNRLFYPCCILCQTGHRLV